MNNDYSFYLFCKLRAIVLPSDEAYDLLYPEDLKLFEDYNDSIFNLEYKGEYECILDYLNYIKEKANKPSHCNDIDGNQLWISDKVVLLDTDDFEGGYTNLERGQILTVTKCLDTKSNFMEFNGEYSFFGHRVLRLV
jgi:hypothetical protein